MTESIEPLESVTLARPVTDGSPAEWQQSSCLLKRVWLLALIAFMLGVAVTLAHRPWSQAESGDEAIWDYVAQCILRGQTPYRDVVEIKTPLSAYLSAAAMWASKPMGVRDVIAVRALNVAMVGILSTVTFLVGVWCVGSRLAAAIAVLVTLAPWHFGEWMATGTEPKLPMILFGMSTLLLIARRRPFWAGFFSMLSFLSWQPGLLFTGVALLMFSRYLTAWRDLAPAKVLLGAFIPLAIVLAYFAWIGALGDLWSWTIAYNFQIYGPETARNANDTLAVLGRVLVRVFRLDLVWAALGLAGLIAFCVEGFKARQSAARFGASEVSYRAAIAIPPLVYLAFCFVNFQSGPDLIPLFPFIGLFTGWLVVKTSSSVRSRGILRPLPIISLIVLLTLILFRAVTYRAGSEISLEAQDRMFAAVAEQLGPGGQIYVHGAVELLVLLNRPNLNPYIFLDRGKDDWIARRRPGGFQALVTEMESAAPKVVALSRVAKVAHRAELEGWVEQHYERFALSYRDVYIRKQD